jgi:hypothetical protein
MFRQGNPRPTPQVRLPMNPSKKTLEVKGNFSKHPFAELLVEISCAHLSGSLRMSRGDQKSIVYFKDGELVFGVSNAREHRLFHILLREKKIQQADLVKYPDFKLDHELSAAIVSDSIMTKADMDEIIASQIREIIIDALTWPDGEWTFNPLVRPRDGLRYQIELHTLLVQFARCVPSKVVLERFRSVQESFSAVPKRNTEIHLQSHEAHVLGRFNGTHLRIEDLRNGNNLPEAGLLQALYVLWLGGLLVRMDWNAAFSATKIGELLTAKLTLIKGAQDAEQPGTLPEAAEPDGSEPVDEKAKLPEVKLELGEYLERAENSETHYDLLGVDQSAPVEEIKHYYFGLAKLFHPDRYHREPPDVLRRIQTAFTQLAHAYETLKTVDSRESYDFKMRRELEAREKRRAAGEPENAPVDIKAEQGLQSFEEGLKMLNEEEYDAAAAFLARAVHYSPENALYHAFYGTALSDDESKLHKAESELQTAVKLDPKNPKIRLMLVDFLEEMNMAKRAVGELKRFLEIVPDNKDAQRRLAKLQGE